MDLNKESKTISPLAVCVNVGDCELLETLLSCKYFKLIYLVFDNIDIEFGLEIKRKSETILR